MTNTRSKKELPPPQIFTSLYKTFSLPLTKFIAKRVGANQELVEEVFAKTMSAAWQGFSKFEHKSSYFTWICRIALNKIADYYRGQVHENSRIVAPFLEEIANVEDKCLSPEEDFALQELRVSIRKCLDALPENTRKLIYLKYWGNLTVKEIAKQFNTSERSIEGKIYRGKNLLKKVFENKYPESSKVYLKK
jgi:RNA polymerase sigma-70 factor, ECF subfamily